MKYIRPEIQGRLSGVELIRHAQNKGGFALVDFISFPFILFATPLAYEADE